MNSMNVAVEPMIKEALAEAGEVLKNQEKENKAKDLVNDAKAGNPENVETIEL
jgi:hypothetical protein